MSLHIGQYSKKPSLPVANGSGIVAFALPRLLFSGVNWWQIAVPFFFCLPALRLSQKHRSDFSNIPPKRALCP
jgi:hypothetical protein